ncbi:MAG: hypothetical protein QOK47_1629 [Actinomycetota bacterium]|nr:hypothetical protein [Actinomycetota bacterium]
MRARTAGDPSGLPVFIHHGTPGAGLFFNPWIEDAKRRGLWLVAWDRPGYGGSDPAPGRTVADVAADVAAIADHLMIDRFASWGISGGGSHVLATAALLPDRVTAVVSLAGGAPWGAEGLDYLAGMGEDNVTEFTLAVEDHDGLRAFISKAREEMLSASDPEEILDALETLLSEVDRAVLTGELARFLYDTDQMSLRPGIEGWYDDDLADVSPWGFDLDSINVPVLLIQGQHDLMVPPAHGRWLEQHVPGVEARFLENEGHLSLKVNAISDAHEWLVAHSS